MALADLAEHVLDRDAGILEDERSGRAAAQAELVLLAAAAEAGRAALDDEGGEFRAVHLEDDVSATADDIGDLSVRHPTDEADRHHPEDRLCDLAHRAHHIPKNSYQST